MMKTIQGQYQKGQNRSAVCEGECYDRQFRMSETDVTKPEGRKEGRKGGSGSLTIFRRSVSVEYFGG